MESFDRETQVCGVFNDGGWPYKVSSRLAFWSVEGRSRVELWYLKQYGTLSRDSLYTHIISKDIIALSLKLTGST